MTLNRRDFLNLTVGVTAGLLVSRATIRAETQSKIKAIAFDGFTTFNPQTVFTLAEALFPGKGAELSSVWRTRQFDYAWLRTLSGRYVDFWQVTEDALVFAAKLLKLELSMENRRQLMDAYLEIKAWPDALPALRSLKDMGIRMAFLSNFTAAMLDAAVKNSGLEDIFEPHLSTDRVRAYKPDPRAYQMAIDSFGLQRDEIVFAAFGGWDAAGAKSFGYPTFWVNRMNLPIEELGVAPDAIGGNLNDVLNFVRSRNTS
ncbi:haloacid dehalogenase type II [Methylomonas sp. 2BW1-5-20]|uniref:haloacid dehalogenase type II n=1 Tax=Methylomonas sp. 2BW1-5-20 TaxID=3376686 RepID=UPI004050AF47